MKNMNELKAFSLNKKQMNVVNGGDAKECAELQRQASAGEVEDWDEWAEKVEAVC